MSEVFREKGFIFQIHPNDHIPSHVHVRSGREQIVINIGDGGTQPSFAKRKRKTRMSNKNAFKAWRIVAENQDYLLRKWREIHG